MARYHIAFTFVVYPSLVLAYMVSINWLLSLGPSLGIVRVRGIGLLHTELVSGIPATFSHFIPNLPAFHHGLVFLCIKSVPMPFVRPEERFLVGRIRPKKSRIYRCIVRYGYHDIHKDDQEFEKDLVCSIAEFIRSGKFELPEEDDKMTVVGTSSTNTEGVQMYENNDNEVKEIESPVAGPSLIQWYRRKKVFLSRLWVEEVTLRESMLMLYFI